MYVIFHFLANTSYLHCESELCLFPCPLFRGGIEFRNTNRGAPVNALSSIVHSQRSIIQPIAER